MSAECPAAPSVRQDGRLGLWITGPVTPRSAGLSTGRTPYLPEPPQPAQARPTSHLRPAPTCSGPLRPAPAEDLHPGERKLLRWSKTLRPGALAVGLVVLEGLMGLKMRSAGPGAGRGQGQGSGVRGQGSGV